MFIDNIEASYLQTRLQGSLDMANAAMGRARARRMKASPSSIAVV